MWNKLLMIKEISNSELNKDIKNAEKTLRHAKEVLRRLLIKKRLQTKKAQINED